MRRPQLCEIRLRRLSVKTDRGGRSFEAAYRKKSRQMVKGAREKGYESMADRWDRDARLREAWAEEGRDRRDAVDMDNAAALGVDATHGRSAAQRAWHEGFYWRNVHKAPEEVDENIASTYNPGIVTARMNKRRAEMMREERAAYDEWMGGYTQEEWDDWMAQQRQQRGRRR